VTLPSSKHIPVLVSEILESLQLTPGQTVIDGTLGGGGHASHLLDQVQPGGHLLGLDRDPRAIDRATEQFDTTTATFVQGNYADLPEILEELEIPQVDGILLDLGLSSDQLDDPERGFSFNTTGKLDLRFNTAAGDPAWKLLKRLSPEHLANLIYQYGEDRLSRRIARAIVKARQSQPVETADQLAAIVRRCYPRQRNETLDPATRTFQALRIAVNDELKWLDVALRRLPDILAVGGRLAIISFHSLEDRRVKHSFRSDSRLRALTNKPIRPGESEINQNPRCRSARLRIAERLDIP
jgi:16S rRNA (cytosine1402-N4)-methyltransferase